jgi:hypothetical protein
MLMKNLILAVAAWVLLSSAGVSSELPGETALMKPSKYLLRLKPKAGTSSVWVIQNSSNMAMEMEQMGGNMKAETAQGTYFSIEVKGRDPQIGEISMTCRMDSAAMRIKSTPGGEMTYNSNTDYGQTEAFGLSQALEPVLNKDMTAMVSQLGVIREIKGLKAAMGGDNEVLGDGTNVNNPFDMLQTFQPVFPEKKVRVGDSWSATFDTTSSGLAIQYVHTYTLSEVRGDLAILTVQSLVNMPAITMESEQGVMDISLKGVQRGELHVQLADGMTRYGKMDQEMEMIMGIMGIVIPTTIEGSSTLYTKIR